MLVSLLMELFQISIYLGLIGLLFVFGANFADISVKIVANFLFYIIVILANIYDAFAKLKRVL